MDSLLRSIPDAWGPKHRAGGLAVTRTRTGPNEIALTPSAHMALVMLTPQPNREVALGSDRRRIGLAPVGALEVVPAGADLFARWVTEKENVLFILDDERLADLAIAEFDTANFALEPPKVGTIDKTALMLARMVREEFARGEAASALCLASLVILVSTHLLRTRSSLAPRREVFVGGLPPRALRAVLDHIKDHLAESLSVADLAWVAGLSPGHFLRAFRTTVGQAPHQYVLDQRLMRAERLIATSGLPLKAVATAAGFCSNSHMTATMRRLRGRAPSDLRREAGRD